MSFWYIVVCLAFEQAVLLMRYLPMQVVPEPVDKWQDIGDGHHNVLKAFYDTPERFAYTFQNYVFVTRMMQVGTVRIYSHVHYVFHDKPHVQPVEGLCCSSVCHAAGAVC